MSSSEAERASAKTYSLDKVYAPDWVSDLNEHHSIVTDLDRPSPCSIATKESYEDTRAEVEQWVSRLSKHNRERFIHRLRSSLFATFRSAYNELYVGQALRDMGFDPTYDHPSGNRTPDWYVPEGPDNPGFYVEVLTTNLSEAISSNGSQSRDLILRIESIHVDADIEVDIDWWNVSIDQRANVEVARELSSWLHERPEQSSSKSNMGIDFRVSGYRSDGEGVAILSARRDFALRPLSLRNRLLSKIVQFKDTAAREGIPLVLVVAPDSPNGLSRDEFLEVLTGSSSQLDPQGAKYREVTFAPSNIEMLQELSAVLWADKPIGGEGSVEIFLNKSAKKGLVKLY